MPTEDLTDTTSRPSRRTTAATLALGVVAALAVAVWLLPAAGRVGVVVGVVGGALLMFALWLAEESDDDA